MYILAWRTMNTRNMMDFGRGVTPLMIAISEGHADVVLLLLSNGADPNKGNGNLRIVHRTYTIALDMYTPIQLACIFCQRECIKHLLSNGLDPNARSMY